MSKGPKLKITPFDPHGERLDLGKRWEKWRDRFSRELKYNGVVTAANPDMAQMALLIYAGHDVEDIHDSLPVPEPVKPEGMTEEQFTVFEKSMRKLNLYFVPKKSNDFALFELLNTKPEAEEATQNYAARLRTAAAKCDFTNWSESKMIKCLVILNMSDEDLRLDCLQKDYTLEDVLSLAQKKEDAQVMSKKIDQEEVHRIGESSRQRTSAGTSNRERRNNGASGRTARWEGKTRELPNSDTRKKATSTEQKLCRNCGGKWHQNRDDCPAIGKMCNYCKRVGHFSKVCYAKMIKKVREENFHSETDDSDDEGEFVDKIVEYHL